MRYAVMIDVYDNEKQKQLYSEGFNTGKVDGVINELERITKELKQERRLERGF